MRATSVSSARRSARLATTKEEPITKPATPDRKQRGKPFAPTKIIVVATPARATAKVPGVEVAVAALASIDEKDVDTTVAEPMAVDDPVIEPQAVYEHIIEPQAVDDPIIEPQAVDDQVSVATPTQHDAEHLAVTDTLMAMGDAPINDNTVHQEAALFDEDAAHFLLSMVPAINKGKDGEDVSRLQYLSWLATGVDKAPPKFVHGFIAGGYAAWKVPHIVRRYIKEAKLKAHLKRGAEDPIYRLRHKGYVTADFPARYPRPTSPVKFRPMQHMYPTSNIRDDPATNCVAAGAPSRTVYPGPVLILPSGARAERRF